MTHRTKEKVSQSQNGKRTHREKDRENSMRRLNLFALLLIHLMLSQSSMTFSSTSFFVYYLNSLYSSYVYSRVFFLFLIILSCVEQFSNVGTTWNINLFDFNQPIRLRDLLTRGVHFSWRIYLRLAFILCHPSHLVDAVTLLLNGSISRWLNVPASTYLFGSFQQKKVFHFGTYARTIFFSVCYSFEDYESIVSSGLC